MTRRRLERDLHDGAQQRLVSLKIKLGIGSSMAEKAGLDDVREMLDSLRVEADDTIEAVRDFARGIYPPLLEAEGLGPAVTSRAHKIPIPLTVHAAGVSRYPRELEATVYFCVLECLQNAVKHSEARSVLVTLSDDDGELSFEVRDDGVGFEVDETPRGSGLTNIADRLDALDGSFDVVSNPGKGTVVHGAIPTREMAVAG
jgi:signal transduction histidine kinase